MYRIGYGCAGSASENVWIKTILTSDCQRQTGTVNELKLTVWQCLEDDVQPKKGNDTGAMLRLQREDAATSQKADVLTEMTESEGGGTELPHRMRLKSHWSAAGRNRLRTRTMRNHQHGRRTTDWTLTTKMTSRTLTRVPKRERLDRRAWRRNQGARLHDGRDWCRSRVQLNCNWREVWLNLRARTRTKKTGAKRRWDESICVSVGPRKWWSSTLGKIWNSQMTKQEGERWRTGTHAKSVAQKYAQQKRHEVCPRRNFRGRIYETRSKPGVFAPIEIVFPWE